MIRRKPDRERTGGGGHQFHARARYLLLLCLLWTTFSLQPSAFSQPLAEGEGYLTADDGVRLFYKVIGSGPETLVVLHGGPGNSMDSLLPDLEPLARKRTIIYYDQRGNGRSELVKKEENLAIGKHIADLESVRRHFGLEKMNLLGNSWGGLLAGFYLIAHPERVARVVLHSPASPSFALLRDSTGYIYRRIPGENRQRFITVSYPDLWANSPEPLKLCQEFYEIIKPVYFTDVSKAGAMKGNTCGGPLEAVRQQLIVNKLIWESLGEWDIQEELGNVSVPALVIHGSDDMIPVESSQAWAAALPDARLLVIGKCGHMTHIEQPEIFFAAVEQFLAGQWPDDAQTVAGDFDTIRITPPPDQHELQQPFLSPHGP